MLDLPFTQDPRFREVSETAWRVLGAGPAAFDGLLAACRSDALTALAADYDVDEAAMFDDVLMYSMGIWSAGDRVARLDQVLAGTVFTHRLTADEVETGMIRVDPDLTVLDADDEHTDVPLTVDQGEIETVYDREHPRAAASGSLIGPAGWLDRFDPGDLVAFRREPQSRRVSIEVVEEPTADVVGMQALEERLAPLRESDPAIGQDFFPVVMDAMIAHPDAFRRPTLPIGELLDRIGFDHRDGHAGPADRSWEPAGVAANRLRKARLAEAFRFDTCCAEAFERVESAWSDFIIDDRLPDDAVVAALDHNAVAPAFLEWVLENASAGSPSLEQFSSALIETHSRHRAAAHYLRAMNLQREGDAPGTEADLRAAAKLDPDHPYVAYELARYAGLRGKGKEAIRLLRRAGANAEEDGSLQFLIGLFERYDGTPRNDPCPCGSGRKYKLCCAVRPRLTGTDRVRWLQRKLYEFVADAERSHVVYDLAEEAAAADPRYDDEDVDAFVDDVFMLDLAAFDVSIDEFIARFGAMLPEDERDLLDLWRLSSRRLWEIISVDRDAGRIALRDGRTGETADVLDVAGATHAEPGGFILARVGTGFGDDHLLGVIRSVDLRHRDMLIEILDAGGDADALAYWYGRVMAPPVITTTEGEPMVIAEIRGAPRDVSWDELITTLDDHYRRVDESTWIEEGVNPAGETITRATITIEGGEVVISALSVERMQRVRQTLPTLDIHSDTREPVDDPRRLAERHVPAGDLPEPTPEMLEVLDRYIDERETKWLDESIPALGGASPRRALDDPTRREDLLALLRMMEGAPPGGFDAARLRRKLGIDE